MDKMEKTFSKLNFDKYLYTCILFALHLAYSISFSSFGPAFTDLKYTLSANMQMVSLFPTILAVGHTSGTLCGLSYKYLNRQFVIIVLLLLMFTASTSVPFTHHIWQYYLCAFGYGISSGAWMLTYNVWLMEIWQEKCGRVLFVSQLIYGIGASFGPMIDAGYLTGEPDNDKKNLVNTSDVVIKNSVYDISVDERRAKLQMPFIIIGAILLFFTLVLTLLFIIRRYQSVIKIQEQKSNAKLFDKSGKKVKIVVIVLSAIILASINSLELIYFNFGSTFFQNIPAHFTASTAAKVSSAMAITYTASQAVNFFVELFFNIKYMIAFHFGITFVVIIALVFAQHSTIAIWVLAVSVGYGFSILYPGLLTSLSKDLEINNRVGTVIWFISGVFNFIPPIILGPFIEGFPMVFVITQIVYLFISVFCVLCVAFITKRLSNNVSII